MSHAALAARVRDCLTILNTIQTRNDSPYGGPLAGQATDPAWAPVSVDDPDLTKGDVPVAAGADL